MQYTKFLNKKGVRHRGRIYLSLPMFLSIPSKFPLNINHWAGQTLNNYQKDMCLLNFIRFTDNIESNE
jgi:hypothetical protein